MTMDRYFWISFLTDVAPHTTVADTDLTPTNDTAPGNETVDTPPPPGPLDPNESHLLMKRLLNETYYGDLDGLGPACLERLKRDGHNETLNNFQQYCVCTLSVCMFLGHTLTAEEELIFEDYAALAEDRWKDERLARRFDSEKLPQVIGVSVSYFLILIVGLFGNILVLVTVARYMGKTTVTNILIASISAGDLLVLVVVLPYQLAYTLYGFWDLGLAFCKIVNILYFASFCCSALSLLVMSVERYIVICHPMKGQVISTTGRAKKMVACVWVVSFLAALPTIPMVQINNNTCGIRGFWFPYTFTYYLCLTVVVLVLPTLVMTWAYTRVSLTLWRSISIAQQLKHKRETKDNNKNGKSDDDVSRERIKVIKMLVLLVVAFALCWGPYWGVRTQRLWRYPSKHWMILADATIGLQTFTYLNSAINPLLYNIGSKPFRRGFKRALCCCRKQKYLAGESSLVTSRTVSSAMSASVATVSQVPLPEKPKVSEESEPGATGSQATAQP